VVPKSTYSYINDPFHRNTPYTENCVSGSEGIWLKGVSLYYVLHEMKAEGFRKDYDILFLIIITVHCNTQNWMYCPVIILQCNGVVNSSTQKHITNTMSTIDDDLYVYISGPRHRWQSLFKRLKKRPKEY